jgi:hypothetical protein
MPDSSLLKVACKATAAPAGGSGSGSGSADNRGFGDLFTLQQTLRSRIEAAVGKPHQSSSSSYMESGTSWLQPNGALKRYKTNRSLHPLLYPTWGSSS